MKQFLWIVGVGVFLSINVWPGQAASQPRTPPGAGAVPAENRGGASKPLLQNLAAPAAPSKVAGSYSQAPSISSFLSASRAEIISKASEQAKLKSPPPFMGMGNIFPAIQPLVGVNPCLISKVVVSDGGLLGKGYRLEGCPVNYWSEADRNEAGEWVNYCYAQMCAEGSCGWIIMGMTDLQCGLLQNATANSLRISTSESIAFATSDDKGHLLIPMGIGLGADLGGYLESATGGAIQ